VRTVQPVMDFAVRTLLNTPRFKPALGD
jgi:hypothetical protein